MQQSHCTFINSHLDTYNNDINAKNDKGETLLEHFCARIDTTPLEVFEYLTQNGALLNISYPLHLAFKNFGPNDDPNILTHLLSQAIIPLTKKDSSGYLVLHRACDNLFNIPINVLKELVDKCPIMQLNCKSKFNITPLHLAFSSIISNKYTPDILPKLRYLLKQPGINVNTPCDEGHTILHHMCLDISKFPLILYKQLLDKYGADINICDSYNLTPLQSALRSFRPGDDVQILFYLLNYPKLDIRAGYRRQGGDDQSSILHLACHFLHRLPFEVFEQLIEVHGCAVNSIDLNGDTPLHFALKSFKTPTPESIKILKYLSNNPKVSINQQNSNGQGVLSLACANMNNITLEIFKHLIEQCHADVNMVDNSNQTPIHIACSEFKHGNNQDVLMYLLNLNNVNINAKRINGAGSIFETICLNNGNIPLEIFQYLIQTKGALIDSNRIGRILKNFIHGDCDVLIYLLKQVEIDNELEILKSKTSNSILHQACENISHVHPKVFLSLLSKCSGLVGIKNINGETPVQIALKVFHPPGDINLIISLLNQENIVNHSNSGFTLLHYACRNHYNLSLGVFKLIVGKFGTEVVMNNKEKFENALNTLFQYADDFNPEIIIYLLRQPNANINTPNRWGRTILDIASGHLDKIPLFLFKKFIRTFGALLSPEVVKSAFEHFNKDSEPKILSFLLHECDWTLLDDWAVVDDHLENSCVNEMLEHACNNINTIPRSIFRFLIEELSGNVHSAIDHSLLTPFHNALRNFNSKLYNDRAFTYLLKQPGINPYLKNYSGFTLLNYSCKNMNRLPLSLFKYLIDRLGSDVNTCNDNNHTPLENCLRHLPQTSQINFKPFKYILEKCGIFIKSTKASELLSAMKGRIFDLDEFTFYVLNKKLVTGLRNEKRYLLWLCAHNELNIDAILHFVNPTILNLIFVMIGMVIVKMMVMGMKNVCIYTNF